MFILNWKNPTGREEAVKIYYSKAFNVFKIEFENGTTLFMSQDCSGSWVQAYSKSSELCQSLGALIQREMSTEWEEHIRRTNEQSLNKKNDPFSPT